MSSMSVCSMPSRVEPELQWDAKYMGREYMIEMSVCTRSLLLAIINYISQDTVLARS